MREPKSVQNTHEHTGQAYKPCVELIEHLAQVEGERLQRARRDDRQTQPTLQMSVRMRESDYLRFKALCKVQRRTNGDMLQHLVQFFLEHVPDHTGSDPSVAALTETRTGVE